MLDWELSMDRTKPRPEADVLWTDDLKNDWFFGIGTMVFDGKIQSCRYGDAVIAVAMLVESRLPGKAFVFGDIEKADIAEAIRWTADFLDKPLTVPVCHDIENLYRRLTAAFSNPVDMIKRSVHFDRGQWSRCPWNISYRASVQLRWINT